MVRPPDAASGAFETDVVPAASVSGSSLGSESDDCWTDIWKELDDERGSPTDLSLPTSGTNQPQVGGGAEQQNGGGNDGPLQNLGSDDGDVGAGAGTGFDKQNVGGNDPPRSAPGTPSCNADAVKSGGGGNIALGAGDRAAIQQALDDADEDDEFASDVRFLLNAVLAAEQAEGKRAGEAGIFIANKKLFRDDILCLFLLEGREMAGWYRENTIDGMLSIELELGIHTDVHIERDFAFWFEERYTDTIDDTIEAAQADGSEPLLGWPLLELKVTHSRMLAVLNPSSAHWFVAEFFIGAGEGEPCRLVYYNSMVRMTDDNPAFVAATVTLPKVLYLASLRPGSPLAGFDPQMLVVEEADCPKQSGSWDCGPFAVYILARRLYNETIRERLVTAVQKQRHGRWIRRMCARLLLNSYEGADEDVSLTEVLWEPDLEEGAHGGGHPAPSGSGQAPATGNSEWRTLRGSFVSEPMIRIEIGRPSARTVTVIIIIRWSQHAHFWFQCRLVAKAKGEEPNLDDFRIVVEAMALDRLAKYRAAAGIDEAVDIHIIIYAGTGLKTLLLPSEPVAQEDEAVEEDADNTDTATQVKCRCPLCPREYQFALKTLPSAYPTIWRHVATHMPQQPKKGLTSDGKTVHECAWDECDVKYVGKKDVTNAAKHLGIAHGKDWLASKKMAVVFECQCGGPTCPRSFTEKAELQKHNKSLPKTKCPCCSSTFFDGLSLVQHMSNAHWDEPVPKGWYSCDKELQSDVTGTNWGGLHETIQKRLVEMSDRQCQWDLAGEACGAPETFRFSRSLRTHYDQEHVNCVWPYSTDANLTRCGKLYQTAATLRGHDLVMHRGSPFTRREREEMRRARYWTEELEADLLECCRRRSASKPVLLSVGLDGFTCNTALLLKWLQRIDQEFVFAIVTEKIPIMEPRHFVAGSQYVGIYDCLALRGGLEDRSTAPAHYAALFNFWERQQAHKNEQSLIRANRNTRVQDNQEVDDDELEQLLANA